MCDFFSPANISGNGRSNGFSKMVRSDSARKRFVNEVAALVAKHDFDGVDYNWEYPGYVFGPVSLLLRILSVTAAFVV